MSEIKIHNINQIAIAELISTEIALSNAHTALDLMIESGALGAYILILHKQSISEEFFDLRTKLAGEIVQKAVNYHFRLVIVGEFADYTSKSLQDFIREGNRGKTINFYASVDEALVKLSAEI